MKNEEKEEVISTSKKKEIEKNAEKQEQNNNIVEGDSSLKKITEEDSNNLFKVEELQEVNKVPDCAYVNEEKEKEEYYLCPCSDGYSPICRACLDKCHAGHGQASSVSGTNICTCGRGNHEVKGYGNQIRPSCIYSKFCEITPSNEQVKIGNKYYCPVCAEKCINKQAMEKENQKENEYQYSNLEQRKSCSCPNSHGSNIISINNELFNKKDFSKHMRNFNVNILFKIQKTKQLYIKSLTDQLKKYAVKKTTQDNFEFFTNFLNVKILELFSYFSIYWKNKYVSISTFLYDFQIDDLLELMSIPKDMHQPSDKEAKDFYNSKLYFAELLFNYFIKSQLIKNNNLFSMKTILNMTVGQRFIYLMNAKDFYIFENIRDNDNGNNQMGSIIQKVGQHILVLFDTIIKQSDQIKWEYISNSFTTFNRIMKYLIKYNLIGEESKNKYFEIVLEALHLFLRKNGDNEKQITLKDTVLHLLKIVLYSAVYENDKKSIEYIVGKESKNNYSFLINDFNSKLCKIFLIVFPYFEREADIKKTIVFDYCVKKFFDLFIVRDDFYSYSLKRFYDEDSRLIKAFNLHPHDFHEYFISDILENKKLFEVISTLSDELGIQTRNYVEYEMDFEIYCRSIGVLLSNFEEYWKKMEKKRINEKKQQEQEKLVGPGQKVLSTYKGTNDPAVCKEVKAQMLAEFKQSLLCTSFIQKIDEIIYFYAKGLEFVSKDDYGNSDLGTTFAFIGHLFKKLTKNDLKMLTLLCNINPESFVRALGLGQPNNNNFPLLIKYMNQMIDLIVENRNILSNDCFHFYLSVLRHLILSRGNSIEHLPDIIKLSGKCVRVAMEKDLNYCSIIELFNLLFESLKQNKSLSCFFETTENDVQSKQFFESYFNFLSELMIHDLYLFDFVKNEIVSLSVVEQCVIDYLNKKTNYESPELEYAIFRYYFLKKLSFNFSFKTIDRQMNNLLNREVNPDYEISLEKIMEDKQEEENTNLKNLMDAAKVMRTVLRNFVCETYNNVILNYYENVLLRPLYSIINSFIRYSELLTGSDCYLIYECIFMFFNITNRIYGGERNNVGFNEVCVKNKLTSDEMDTICKELGKLSESSIEKEESIRYYELPKLYESLLKIIKIVLKHKTESKESDDSSNTNIEEELPTIVYSDLLINHYSDEKKNTYDEKLVFINALKVINNETAVDSRQDLLEYFIFLIFDPLNENYVLPSYLFNPASKIVPKITEDAKFIPLYYKNIVYKPNKEIKIEEGKFQNSYALLYLNELFFHDSNDFQNGFTQFFDNRDPMKKEEKEKENNDEKKKKQEALDKEIAEITSPCLKLMLLPRKEPDDKSKFLTYISKNIIFTSILAEVQRRYSIDYISENDSIGRNENSTFKFAKISLKFIQNLCEGHNKEYQTFFFESYFTKEGFILIPPNKLLKDIENANTKKKNDYDYFDQRTSTNNSRSLRTSYIETGYLQKNRDTEFLLLRYDCSFINFLFFNMQIIINSLHPKNEFHRELFSNIDNLPNSINDKEKKLFLNIEIKNNENLLELYQGFSDLIVEMLQGTDPKNYRFLYNDIDILKNLDYFTVNKAISQIEDKAKGERMAKSLEKKPIMKREFFQFMMNALNTAKSLFDNPPQGTNSKLSGTINAFKNKTKKMNELFNPLSYEMKYRQFCIINQVISQDNIPMNIITQLNTIFPADKLINVISNLLCKIYKDKIMSKDQNNPEINCEPYSIALDGDKLNQLQNDFKKNHKDIYEDQYFKLASQMHLFIIIMAEKYIRKEALQVVGLKNENITDTSKSSTSQVNGESLPTQPASNEEGYTKLKGNTDMEDTAETTKRENIRKKNNNIVTCKFFNDIIKKVEFKVPQDNERDLHLKIIYFIINPEFYSISNNSITQFKNNVDRSSSTTKIRSLIDSLDLFLVEVENTKGFEIDFRKGVNVNFWVTLAINIILLFFVSGNGSNQFALRLITTLLILGQVAANIYLVIRFLLTKYNFYVEIEKKKYKKINVFNYLKIYILDSFLLNDEISLINYLIVLGIFGIFLKYNLFCFVLQLLTVINFVDTIQEIVTAFKLRFGQLFFMICFLAILIFFYANLGFYFYVNEFDTTINSQTENFCQSLLECTITYFNHGVRAGGGIGDIIGDKAFDDMGAYYTRWVTDLIFYITVILLLLNMINGVIVSTFSQIRENSQNKDDDINNYCFICNIERKIFEKKKIDFKKHQDEEHNLEHYIMFFIYVKRINPKDLDADQSFIVQCLNEKQNTCFPLKMSKSIGEVKDEQTEDEEED